MGQRNCQSVQSRHSRRAEVPRLKSLPPLTEPEPNHLDLILNIYADCFNPRGNKIAGKKELLGLIALTCPNLPPSTRNLVGNTCIAGLIPGPNEPDMTTISHILNPLIDELLILEKGVNIKTYKYPQGRIFHVRLLALIGDIVSVQKCAGYASHLPNLFCSWCECTKSESSDLCIGKKRTKKDVLAHAEAWAQARTLNKNKDLVTACGIRDSSLNLLRYRHPVNHVPLGIMHNWLEGILQHHFRYQWGFRGKDPQKKRGVSTVSNRRRCGRCGR